ncbi:energy-coupling factor transporter transmembrane component T family protein [Fictibacillus phosphorivorans]|uniref:energy-coupling factor transporter transmembrane component T family protein n=1 Tax=Fictibacillus phosphorivorans TaxID=1221500 RepID=UPI00203AF228|nr:energy-coupling factor transporter transmembrane component T [Fictibacillus phosphorivorans]MCM3718639.1 energy-coupling factor transporter transmembrane protein EcfT [Fictibacillus phosphorivorans]MCM3776262.1 energy-coupling factor transporter transmembrane protein EcfT [Fictibacillus phosphorivorans]
MERPGKFILNLYPTTKFLFAFCLMMTPLLLPGYLYSYMVPVLCLVIALIAGKTKLYVNFVLKGLVPIVVMIFLLQSFFYPGDTVLWSWSIFSIKQEGIHFSLQLTSKILAIGSSIVLFFQITKINDLSRALELMGISPKATYVLSAALNIIPEMRLQLLRIMDAQKTRGVETEGSLTIRMKAFVPALTPLILSSFSSTDEKAITLESRAFTARTKKTSLHHLEKTKSDHVVRALLVIAVVSILIGRFFL